MPESRLGDIIDDYCIKCRRLTNHSVVSILHEEPAKVRCRTCYNDHDYRREQAPPPKIDSRKAALFNEVLAKMPEESTPPAAGAAHEAGAGQAAGEADGESAGELAGEVELIPPKPAKALAKPKVKKAPK